MSTTLYLNANNPRDIAQAAAILRSGGTVAFPTETVYGLGANALSVEAVAGIFAAKQRPAWDPLIVHVASYSEATSLVMLDEETNRRAEALARAFWPGPLTLLLPRTPVIPDAVTAGRPLVGIRVPGHPAAQALLREVKLPLAAPSANLFGHTSPTTAQHVLDDLAGRIDAVLDGGATNIGLESTVLDPTTTPMTLYRPGALTRKQLAAAAGVSVQVFQPAEPQSTERSSQDGTSQAALPSPGVGLRHYAPHARLILTEGNPGALTAALTQAEGRAGILLPKGWKVKDQGCLIEPWAPWDAPDRLAATLFQSLRSLDARGAETIFCPLPSPGGLRDAIRDRLQKAARLD